MIDLKIKKKKAFSLAEVMIALVIVAILMAASAPLVNRRASIDNSFSCYWKNATNGIYFNEKGTGQVGIGTEPTNAKQVLHLASNKEDEPQIAFYSSDLKTIDSVLGIYNDNIHIGAEGNIGGSNNVVIGQASETYKADGNKLIIGAKNTATPILYGEFAQDLTSQLLKVNGQLQVGTTSSNSILDKTKASYSMIVDGNGIYSYGNIRATSFRVVDSSNDETLIDIANNLGIVLTKLGICITTDNGNYGISNVGAITGTTINGTSLSIGTAGDTANASISSDGSITGTSLSIGDASIAVQENQTTAFRIGAASMSSDGSISGTNIEANELETKTLGSTLRTLIDERIASVSDKRLKKDIKDTAFGLDTVRKMNIKEYKFKDEKKYGEGVRFGVIAQELQKILPNVVKKNSDGFLSIRSNDIFFVAINAIKELDNQLQSLKNQNKELKDEIKLLKDQNQKLEKRLSKIEKQFKLD